MPKKAFKIPKKEINNSYYQKNKEKLKTQRKEQYIRDKKQAELEAKKQTDKYYQANSIKVLMSFKEYTELSKEKMKIWTGFNWTLKNFKEGIGNIEEIMRLRELADNLINDYWTTAKGKIKKSKSWNNLSEEQQQQLIRYWSYEKVRKESQLAEALEKQKQEAKKHEKELELAKFHEERGKINCECWQCEESKQIQGEIKKELFKEDKTEKEQKEQCPECKKWVKELDEESGVCKSCKKKYE